MSKRGTGSIYLRGKTYWIRYSHRGQEFRESADTESETIASRLLKRRIQETGRRGKFLGPAEERLRFEDLAEMLRSDYRVNERRSLRRLEASLKQLQHFFGLDRVVDITADRISSYALQRRETGAANATINRELAALKRAIQIAVDTERVSRAPSIKMLEERNIRQGFLEHAEYSALIEALPERLKDPIRFLYLSGWRSGEMKSLERSDVDLPGKVIRLPPAKSKNDDGRILPLSGELAEVMARAHQNRRLECTFVFHEKGRPLVDFRDSWNTACIKAGLGKILVHDMRRTTVRNLVRAGVPERIAMAITGHKTRSVFDRYNIVSEADLLTAMERRDEYLRKRPTERKVIPIELKRVHS